MLGEENQDLVLDLDTKLAETSHHDSTFSRFIFLLIGFNHQ